MSTTITVREFIRNFSRFRRTVATGGEITIRDRNGRVYVFRAKENELSLGQQLADLCGKHNTGIRAKAFAGFGTNRK